jgi:hypothetical protein
MLGVFDLVKNIVANDNDNGSGNRSYPYVYINRLEDWLYSKRTLDVCND